MGVIVNKKNDDNELTRRINADLRAKMEGNTGVEKDAKTPDFAEDAEYMKDLKKTGKFGWVWILLVVLAIVILIGVGISLNK